MIPQAHRYTLENAPRYNGWENVTPLRDGNTLCLTSSRHPGVLLLDMEGDEVLVRAGDCAGEMVLAAAGCSEEPYHIHVNDFPHFLRTGAEAASLPHVPGKTESKAEIAVRLKQQLYRSRLMLLWNNTCAVTGCSVPALLKASHAKPWKDATPFERIDPYNGFLLEARYDALFDQGLITFSDEGKLILSPKLPTEAIAQLGLSTAQALRFIAPKHLPYLRYHRESIFQA